MSNKRGEAFTLMEVIISLGIVAFISFLFVSNLDTILSSVSRSSPEKILNEAVNRASNLAQSLGEEVQLAFDEEGNALTISTYVDLRPLESYNMPIEDMEVSFEVVYPKIIDGSASTFRRIEKVNSMRFFPDGTSAKIRITLEYHPRKYSVVFDCFSSMKLEDSDDDK